MNKKLIFILIIFFLVSALIYSMWDREGGLLSPNSLMRNEDGTHSNVLTPSPYPFQEYTIPYLRSRTYESAISESKLLESNNSYESFLATYNSDDLKIQGLLTKPLEASSQQQFPAIVFVHGYIPPTLYKTQERYQSFVDYFARKGFVVFKIDLRGHGESEGEASGAYFSNGYVIDTLSAYEALKSLDYVDPTRIGLWGHSMAGNIVLRSVAAKQDIPAAVIFAGAVYTYQDMRDYGIDDNSYRPPTTNTNRSQLRQQMFDAHGQFNIASEFWQQMAPVNFLDDVSTALQIHHPVDDQVVSVEYSRNLNQILDQKQITHELIEYPSGSHNFTGSTFSQAMQKSVEFFQKHL